ncbi:iron-containing alcohol dehydrogenase [Shigella flexneri]
MPVAREHVHSAATIAGIAFANAFLGVCHSMAHKLGSQFHIPHGLANALLICNVTRYNANDDPTKQTAFSQYDRPQARRRYAEIAATRVWRAGRPLPAAKDENCWHGWKR